MRRIRRVLAFLIRFAHLRSFVCSFRSCASVVACGIFSYRLACRLVLFVSSCVSLPVCFSVPATGASRPSSRSISSRHCVSSSCFRCLGCRLCSHLRSPIAPPPMPHMKTLTLPWYDAVVNLFAWSPSPDDCNEKPMGNLGNRADKNSAYG